MWPKWSPILLIYFLIINKIITLSREGAFCCNSTHGAQLKQALQEYDALMAARNSAFTISQIEEGKFTTVGLGRSEPTLAQAILQLSLPET